MIKDLTIGDPKEVLWKFSLPMFISVIFQQLYNIADSIIAGKFAGEDALAAVGASYPITMIFMAIAVGSNIGCSVVISQLFGSKDIKNMKTAISTTVLSSFILSAILTVTGFITTPYMMSAIKTPANIFQDGSLYLKIYIAGFMFLFIYNICTGIFQSLGDSKTPLYFLIGSSIGNVVLDYLFVAIFKWGVSGVAWATFIAQGIAGVLAFIALICRVKKIECVERSEYFSFSMLKKVSIIAVPSILQQSFISIGNIFIQGIINSYGSSVIAGYSAAVKLNTFTLTSFTTLSNGLSSFTAQNIGAGKPERIKAGFKAGAAMTLIIAVPFFVLFFFFGDASVRLFMENESTELALKTGIQFLKIVSPFYFIISIKLAADGVLRGTGSMVQFMISTFTDLILRVVLSIILSPIKGTIGIWLSWPIGWTAAMILSVIFYRFGKWNKK